MSNQVLEAIVGLQWGDEGKGKIVDEAISRAKDENGKRSVVVRFQGGANAGHTLYVDKEDELQKFVTHSAPSGLAHNVDIAIGPSVAFNPIQFLEEVEQAQELFGYDGRIMISERTGILLDYHKQLDAWREDNRKDKIGTTKSGIGPFYQDAARRDARITFRDYVTGFEDKLASVWKSKKDELEAAGIPESEIDRLIEEHKPVIEELRPFAERLEYRLNEYLENGNIVIEGAQGSMLDVDMGTIPDTTSSHLLAPHAFASLGLPRREFKVYGVEKVYPTRVGSGNLPTLDEKLTDFLVKNAGEKGATTGRPRRAGFPDWVLIARSAMVNDCDGIYLTRTDCVQGLDLLIATAYMINNEITREVPMDLEGVFPNYDVESFSWKLWDGPENLSVAEDVDDVLKEPRMKYIEEGFDSLPEGLQDYVTRHDGYMRENVGRNVPVAGISIGPARGETVMRDV